jgi:hypothetical protein
MGERKQCGRNEACVARGMDEPPWQRAGVKLKAKRDVAEAKSKRGKALK